MGTVLVRLGTTIALVSVALGIAALSAGGAPAKPTAHYVVNVDPRLCPSPLCGGYWVSLANRSRTRCHDGVQRARCYVASAWPASRRIEDGALVRGGIAEQTIQGFGRLGLLIATDVRNPVGPTESGSFFRLRELAVRCIRDPCFSIRASRLNGRLTVMLSGVDLTETKLANEEKVEARALQRRALRRRPHRPDRRRRSRVPRVADLPQSVEASRLRTSQAVRTSSSVVRKFPIASRSA